MPVVFRDRGRRFHFYSDEGSPREPVHIHVSEPGKEAKFWLVPSVRLARKIGYNDRELGDLIRLVEANRDLIEQRWNDFFAP
jgi:Domain of unknown function (DUF4160)